MSQDYTLIDFKANDYRDDYRNAWVDVVFKGVSEPVKWVMSEKTLNNLERDKTYYGRLEDKTSKAGKPYNRFYSEQKENTPGTPENATKEDSIHKSVALQQAVLFKPKSDIVNVLEAADAFYAWLKGEDTTEEEKDSEKARTLTNEELEDWDGSDELRDEDL